MLIGSKMCGTAAFAICHLNVPAYLTGSCIALINTTHFSTPIISSETKIGPSKTYARYILVKILLNLSREKEKACNFVPK